MFVIIHLAISSLQPWWINIHSMRCRPPGFQQAQTALAIIQRIALRPLPLQHHMPNSAYCKCKVLQSQLQATKFCEPQSPALLHLACMMSLLSHSSTFLSAMHFAHAHSSTSKLHSSHHAPCPQRCSPASFAFALLKVKRLPNHRTSLAINIVNQINIQCVCHRALAQMAFCKDLKPGQLYFNEHCNECAFLSLIFSFYFMSFSTVSTVTLLPLLSICHLGNFVCSLPSQLGLVACSGLGPKVGS